MDADREQRHNHRASHSTSCAVLLVESKVAAVIKRTPISHPLVNTGGGLIR